MIILVVSWKNKYKISATVKHAYGNNALQRRYLEPNQVSTTDFFPKNSYQLKARNYFRKKFHH